MKWLKRILLASTVLIGILSIGLLASYYFAMRPIASSGGYSPLCNQTDTACNTWHDFRKSHPFPYQSVAAKNVGTRKVIVVVSEPSANVDKPDLDQSIRSLFPGTVSSQRLRWRIGEDGWLEDLVLTIEDPTADEATRLASLRDGFSRLFTMLYGTAYGGEVEEIVSRSAGSEKLAVPSYHVTPKELGDWMHDPSLTWRGHNTDTSVSWPDLVAAHQIGVFDSSDGRIVMLTFPSSVIIEGPQQQVLASLQVPFREFAVGSEGVVGGLWTRTGQVALIARVRTTPQRISPPLRYETFSILLEAARNTEELAQSYERTQAFAGKLMSGQYAGRDWAPVYLSPQLADTEFGALLNVTDQMLKSWSSAGQVEYLYFDYKKPENFPFGRTALADIVRKETGETSLLFNWNTAGSAVVVGRGDQSILTSTQSGSLPITYGAGGKTVDQGGAQLYDYEDKAYEYFSSLRDPNLQRVVQYTLMYQLFRAIVKDNNPKWEIDGSAENTNARSDHAKRADDYLVGVTTKFLRDFMADPGAFQPKEAAATLQSFVVENSAMSGSIAAILSAPRSDEAKDFTKALVTGLEGQKQTLATRQEALDKRINEYNKIAQRANEYIERGQEPEEPIEKMAVESAAIRVEQSSLEADAQKFMAIASQQSVMNARKALYEIIAGNQDLEPIRAAYVEASRHEPNGSIKTPSIVLSWNNKDTYRRVGGHNLDSKALRFEASADVEGIQIATTSDGLSVVRYNPSMAESIEEAAPSLARAFEHRNEKDVEKLKALLNENTSARSRENALLFNADNPPPTDQVKAFAKLGERIYTEKRNFVDDIRTLAGENNCCIYVTHDAERNAYVAEPNLAPPPLALVYEVHDSPTLTEHLRRALRGSAGATNRPTTVFLDEPEGFADSLLLSLQDGKADLDTALALGAGESPPPVPPGGRVSLFSAPDFDGKRSSFRFLFEPIATAKKALFRLAGRPIASDVWNAASVTTMDAQQVQDHLAVLKWDIGRDGSPVAVKVTLNDFDANLSQDMSVIAGVDEGDVSASKALLYDASREAVRDAAQQGASAGRYLLTIKDRLKLRSPQQLKRLVLVMKSGETKMYFTRLDRPPLIIHSYGRHDVG